MVDESAVGPVLALFCMVVGVGGLAAFGFATMIGWVVRATGRGIPAAREPAPAAAGPPEPDDLRYVVAGPHLGRWVVVCWPCPEHAGWYFVDCGDGSYATVAGRHLAVGPGRLTAASGEDR